MVEELKSLFQTKIFSKIKSYFCENALRLPLKDWNSFQLLWMAQNRKKPKNFQLCPKESTPAWRFPQSQNLLPYLLRYIFSFISWLKCKRIFSKVYWAVLDIFLKKEPATSLQKCFHEGIKKKFRPVRRLDRTIPFHKTLCSRK